MSYQKGKCTVVALVVFIFTLVASGGYATEVPMTEESPDEHPSKWTQAGKEISEAAEAVADASEESWVKSKDATEKSYEELKKKSSEAWTTTKKKSG